MPPTDARPFRSVLTSRVVAFASSVAFVVLCATMAALGRVAWVEAVWAVLAVVVVFVPTGWWAPAGWRRRAAEALLVLPAWAMIMLADPVLRRMMLPPLLAAAAWAALAAAWPRVPERRRLILVVALAVAVRAAAGMGLLVVEWWFSALAVVAAAAVAWAGARIGGRDLGVAMAFLAAAAPLQTAPWAAGGVLLTALAVGFFGDSRVRRSGGVGWLPGAVGLGLLALSVAGWGGLDFLRLFPDLGGWAIAGAMIVVVLTRFLPPGAAGALWFVVALGVGPALAPTPDRPGFHLGSDEAGVDLPAGTGAPYILDMRLDGEADLVPGTVVARLDLGAETRQLTYPNNAVHRSGRGADTSATVHRPEGIGRGARWRAAARTLIDVEPGVVPHVTRHPDLPDGARVVLEAVGPCHPTPPRSRDLAWWMAAAAVVVALLQVSSGTWCRAFAVTPWTVLVVGALAARAWVEPLRLLAERHAVDLAMAALLTAWLPAAVVWLKNRRAFVATAALLIPLAAATPLLTPPLYGDEPFHLTVMESILRDGDVSLADNVDLDVHPGEAVYDQGGDLLHSPVLGILLLPGFVVAGRMGALILLALASSAGLALVARRARRLGVPEARLCGLVLVMAATYPAAVFATQLWVEMVGALAVAAILLATAGGRGGRWAAVAWALLATAVKTRLALLAFPPAAAVWWVGRRNKVTGVVVFGLTAAAAAVVGCLTMGHPFGIYRRLEHLLPTDPGLAARVVGGLIFDPSGGLLFAAPLWLLALAGVVRLWRRGGPGERLLLAGCGLTVFALLPSMEWYGGGSPPARYLVPMLPAFALAGGMLLRAPLRWRAIAQLLVLPSVVVWWVLMTRPHLGINPGDGGWWAADALARSYLADTAWLVPSFLVPRTATWVVPLAFAAVVLVLGTVARWRPGLVRRFSAAGAAIWLLAAAGLAAAVELRTDRVVEAEAPQVRRFGGTPRPAKGTFSRFTHRRGWMMRDGDRMVVPLNLPEGAVVHLDGWLLGAVKTEVRFALRWDDGETVRRTVPGDEWDGRLRAPQPPGPGRRRLAIEVDTTRHRAVVLDRVVVEAGR